jgi:hypothetical protein
MQPGAAAIEEAVDDLTSAIGDLDGLSISVAVGNIEPLANGKSKEECQEELVKSV